MSQDALFTHFHPVPCGISEIIDTQEALEASANKEDDSVSWRDDGTSSEDAVSRRDDAVHLCWKGFPSLSKVWLGKEVS